MSKSAVRMVIEGAAISAVAATLAVAPAAAATGCAPGSPSVLVHVAGFKQPQGRLKLSLYGPASWLDKRGRISKIKVPVTGRSMDICVPVPAPGRYAVAVHHDLNVNGERDRQDGGGYSRDPKVTLFNPRPPFAKAAFTVGNGPARVGVTLLYIKGISVGPAGS
ncbi:MAG TPA: DUF2141 domain-containing protein [Sphingomicrobium sp.]|nr:DUF2141 domain-containing protein [Sphingomicrobium sp.]